MRSSLLPAVITLAAAIPAAIGFASLVSVTASAEEAVELPAAAYDPAATGLQTLVIAGGCFWGIQAIYQHTEGVTSAVSGYAGGAAADAHYELVGRGNTGHAEAVEVVFDPAVVSTGEILRIFFSVAHDPTQLNRQGPDWGPQYRSAIFYGDETQREVATQYIAQLGTAGAWSQPIVTLVDPLEKFYPAEDYHQDYVLLHPDQPYVYINDLPKLDNFARLFPDRYRTDPVTVASTK